MASSESTFDAPELPPPARAEGAAFEEGAPEEPPPGHPDGSGDRGSGPAPPRPQKISFDSDEMVALRERIGRLVAGPIVRHVDRQSASFWMALQLALPSSDALRTGHDGAVVRVDVSSSGEPVARGEGRIVAIGRSIGLVLVTVRGAFEPGPTYHYQPFLVTDGPSEGGTALIAKGDAGFCYPPFDLPGFVVPGPLADSATLYGSCRKTGGHGPDMLAFTDGLLARSIADPGGATPRPQVHYLLGDQIYADDVDPSLLRILLTWVIPGLFGYNDAIDAILALLTNVAQRMPETALPADERLCLTTDDPLEQVVRGLGHVLRPANPGSRDWIARGSGRLRARAEWLSSSAADSHLLGFAEYAAMYLVVWSPALLRAVMPDLAGAPERWQVTEKYGSPTALQARVGELVAVRRALANCATYMVFDDHEITDDWYLDAPWRSRVLGPVFPADAIDAADTPERRAALTEAIGQRPPCFFPIAAGLSAFALFQAWGNTPERFASERERHLLHLIPTVYADRFAELFGRRPYADDEARLARLWDLWRLLHLTSGSTQAGRGGAARWHFYLRRDDHEVFGLDTRTWRRGGNDALAVEVISPDGVAAQIVEAPGAPADGGTPPRLTVLLSPAPWFGFPMVEDLVLHLDEIARQVDELRRRLEVDARVEAALTALDTARGGIIAAARGLVERSPMHADRRAELLESLRQASTGVSGWIERVRHVLDDVRRSLETLGSSSAAGALAEFADRESPGHNPVGHQQLLAALHARDRQRRAPGTSTPIVVLSGDVHYGFQARVNYHARRNPYLPGTRDAPDPAGLDIVQLCASAHCNQEGKTLAVGAVRDRVLTDEGLCKLTMGWFHGGAWDRSEGREGQPAERSPRDPRPMTYRASTLDRLRSTVASLPLPCQRQPWSYRSRQPAAERPTYFTTTGILPLLGLRDLDLGRLRLPPALRAPDVAFSLVLDAGEVEHAEAGPPGGEGEQLAAALDVFFGDHSGGYVVGFNNAGLLTVRGGADGGPLSLDNRLYWGATGHSDPEQARVTRWQTPLPFTPELRPQLPAPPQRGALPASIDWRTPGLTVAGVGRIPSLREARDALAAAFQAVSFIEGHSGAARVNLRVPVLPDVHVFMHGTVEVANEGAGITAAFIGAIGIGAYGVARGAGAAVDLGGQVGLTIHQATHARVVDALIAYLFEMCLAAPAQPGMILTLLDLGLPPALETIGARLGVAVHHSGLLPDEIDDRITYFREDVASSRAVIEETMAGLPPDRPGVRETLALRVVLEGQNSRHVPAGARVTGWLGLTYGIGRQPGQGLDVMLDFGADATLESGRHSLTVGMGVKLSAVVQRSLDGRVSRAAELELFPTVGIRSQGLTALLGGALVGAIANYGMPAAFDVLLRANEEHARALATAARAVGFDGVAAMLGQIRRDIGQVRRQVATALGEPGAGVLAQSAALAAAFGQATAGLQFKCAPGQPPTVRRMASLAFGLPELATLTAQVMTGVYAAVPGRRTAAQDEVVGFLEARLRRLQGTLDLLLQAELTQAHPFLVEQSAGGDR